MLGEALQSLAPSPGDRFGRTTLRMVSADLAAQIGTGLYLLDIARSNCFGLDTLTVELFGQMVGANRLALGQMRRFESGHVILQYVRPSHPLVD